MTKAKINVDLFNKLTQRYANQKSGGSTSRGNYPDNGFDFDALHGVGRYIIRLMPYEADEVSAEGTIMPFYIQNRHYNLGADRKERAICTGNLSEGAVCPICDALEELRELGFPQDQLRAYEVSTKVVLKCLLLQTPEKTRAELPMNRMTMLYVSLAVATKIMEKYQDPVTPDLFNPEKSCAIVIERDKPKDKWAVYIMDSSCEECGMLGFTEENKNKLLEISSKTKFSNIFKAPTDEKIMHYKELARELKKTVINAKNTVESATNEFKAEIEAASAAAPAKIEVAIPTTMIAEEHEVVATPVVPQVAVNHVVEQPTIQQVVTSAVPTAPATPVATTPAEEVLGPDPEWTPEQKQIIDSYRGICDKPCFGNLKAYNPKCQRCLADNFSAQCNAAIRLAYGVNVPLF